MSLKNLENLQETLSPANQPPISISTTPQILLPLSAAAKPISSNLETESSDIIATTTTTTPTPTAATTTTTKETTKKNLQDTSRNSDSGKSSSCSPTLLDCSFDSGIAGVLLDSSDMQLHKRIQQCQRILLALEREREHFGTIRNRLSKISDRKKKKPSDAEYLCNVCCAEIDPEDDKTFVKCYICQKYICRSIKCADWLAKTAQWECELCQTSKESMAQTSSWVADQISFNQHKLVYPMRARSEIFIPISECNDSSIHFESVSQIGANSALMTAEQKLKIREYVEEIVSKLLGGNLDTIAVNQLSKSENYLPAPKTNGHHHYTNGSIVHHSNDDQHVSRESTPGPDFTDISEARLRNMIQKIISETMNMPPLSKTHAVSEIALDRPSKMVENGGLANGHRHRTEHYFEPQIYQDLLATAVLNKIVDKQSNNNRTMAESSPDLSRATAGDDEGETGGRQTGLDQNYNVENQSITSGSSVEPRSDCSYTDTEPIVTTHDDKSSELLMLAGRDSAMSDYLAGHMVPLPDLSTIATESEEDDYMSVTSSAVGDSTWENNWLFKKKKPSLGAAGSVSTSSVGMLVPDPKEYVRAQIGDKTADEISDLSELGSDTDDSSMDLLRSNMDPINNRLFNKHLIGGQNSKMVLDELIERSSMISNTLPTEQEEAYTETLNEHVDDPSKTEAINANVSQQNNSNNNNQADQKDLEVIMPPTGFEDGSNNPLTGSIAEREYKKWYNAVEMPNNPYAPEALKRRISGSQERFIDLPNKSPLSEQCPLEMITKETLENDEADKRESEYRRYSRDYYINDALKSSQISSPVRETANPKDAIEDEQKTEQELPVPETSQTLSPPLTQTKEDIVLDLYKAIPAQVVEDNTTASSSLDTMSQQSIQSGTTTTSDDSDTIKIYDFKKQETTTIVREVKEAKEKTDNEVGTKDEQAAIAEPTVAKERPKVLSLNRQEASTPVAITPTRGSTPVAFKFLQPKRKLLDPSQVLSLDEDEPQTSAATLEKPVIEKEVVHAMPSVKALAKAFLMTSSSLQHKSTGRMWLRKSKTLPAAGKSPTTPIKPLETPTPDVDKSEEDVTITSDLSSLETDPSAACKATENTKEQSSAPTTENTPTTEETADNASPVPVRQGVLKSNIAFFENLKFK